MTLVYYVQTVGWISLPLGVVEVDLGTGYFVLDEDPAPIPKKGEHSRPSIFGHVCCGQTAGWVKMPLSTKLGVGPGHIVLDGDSASPWKGAKQLHHFWTLMSIVAKGLDAESRCQLVRR